MTTRLIVSRSSAHCTLAAIAAATLAGVASAAVVGVPDATVAVHARHYSTGGRAYTDLDELEAALRTTRPASLRIVACEATATRAWLAAVPRFDDLTLYLDVDPAAPACGPIALPVGAASKSRPTGIDDVAVKRYWEHRLP